MTDRQSQQSRQSREQQGLWQSLAHLFERLKMGNYPTLILLYFSALVFCELAEAQGLTDNVIALKAVDQDQDQDQALKQKLGEQRANGQTDAVKVDLPNTSNQETVPPNMGIEYEDLSLAYVYSHDLTPLYNTEPPKYSALDIQAFGSIPKLETNSVSKDTKDKSVPSSKYNTSFEWETELIIAFKKLRYLKLITPKQNLLKLKRLVSNNRLIKLADDFIKQSDQAYKLVDLERAQAFLDSAIELLIQARYSMTNSHQMGLLYMRRAVVAVEQKQFLLAAMNFREALLLAPYLRLKKGFDSDATVEVFKTTLRQLQNLNAYELIKLAERREWKEGRQITLMVTKLKSEFFASVWQMSKGKNLKISNGLAKNLLTRQELDLLVGETSTQAMKRLATQIWNNLPFLPKKTPPKQSKPWQVMSGWGLSTPLKSPVSTLTFPGIVIEAKTQAFRQLQLTWGSVFANSTQDAAKDLRKNFTIAQGYFGPLWSKVATRWWFTLGVMLEFTYLGSTQITRSVGCKFFDLESQLPLEICNPGRDIRNIQDSWRLGPRFQMSFGLRLVRSLSVGLQFNASGSFYEHSPHPFDWPIGMAILIGYSFNSQ